MAVDHEQQEQRIGHLLREFTAAPGAGAFEQIRHRLEKRRRRRIAWVVLLAAGLLSTPLLYFIGVDPPKAEVVINRKQAGNAVAAPIPGTDPGPVPAATEKIITLKEGPQKAPGPLSPVNADELPIGTADRSVLQENSAMTEDTLTIALAEQLLPVAPPMLPVTEGSIVGTDSVVIPERMATEVPAPSNRPGFFVGAFFTPQYGGLQLAPNPRVGEFFGDLAVVYGDEYLAYRRSQNPLRYNHSFGISGGTVLNLKWEVIAGLGLQRITYEEALPPVSSGTAIPNMQLPSTSAYHSSSDASSPDHIRLRYVLTSFSVSRLMVSRKGTTFKIGAGVSVNRLLNNLRAERSSPVMYSPGAQAHRLWLLVPSLKAGIVEQITPWLQFQACPLFYFSANSMYRNDFLIRQRTYGAGLEIGLYFHPGK